MSQLYLPGAHARAGRVNREWQRMEEYSPEATRELRQALERSRVATSVMSCVPDVLVGPGFYVLRLGAAWRYIEDGTSTRDQGDPNRFQVAIKGPSDHPM